MLLSNHAKTFINSSATVATSKGQSVVLIDRNLCAKGSALSRAKHRWIVYCVSASLFGDWQSYSNRRLADHRLEVAY